MSLLKVRVIGCAGVGKRSLRKVVCKQFPVAGADVEDEDFDDDDDTVEHQAYLNSQTTVVVCENIFVTADEEEPEEETAALLPGGRKGKGPLLKKPNKKGPMLRTNKSKAVSAKDKLKGGFGKAMMVGKMNAAQKQSRAADDDRYDVGYLVVFDIGDSASFAEAEKQLARLVNEEQQPCVLVGNKVDKSRRYRRILYEEGLELAQRFSDVPYIETSAKLNQRVDQAFLTIIKKLQANLTRSDAPTSKPQSGNSTDASTAEGEPEAEDSRGCCEKLCASCPKAAPHSPCAQ